jgi:hypothetical protein
VPIFSAEEERAIRELLAESVRPVELALVLGPGGGTTTLVGGRAIEPEAETRRLLAGVAELGRDVTVTEHGEGAFGVALHPAVVVLPAGEDVGIRFYGTPWGYELTSLVGAVAEAGRAEPSLPPEALASLERDVALQVFVTPT